VFPPYGALAGELILGNEAVIECDGLAQGFPSFRGVSHAQIDEVNFVARRTNPESRAVRRAGFRVRAKTRAPE
jgi:hypothetical protein